MVRYSKYANVQEHGLEMMIFFFCQWESESEEDVLKALTSKGMDEYIFTALYPIDMHIDIKNLTGKIPYEPIFYLDDEYNPEKG